METSSKTIENKPSQRDTKVASVKANKDADERNIQHRHRDNSWSKKAHRSGLSKCYFGITDGVTASYVLGYN